ncbi:hypothetical protein SPD48_15290 [Pseudogracilibacillus sp. SE30717A]|uniref:hypothetical protein n=1 Tax=Pseudogracilibacillus sp. SE30717A TaxID=3098293 RepID=UPI00300E1056
MHHPLYRTASEYINSPVEIRDYYGESYRGTLEYVTPDGVYLDTGSDGIFFPFLTIASLVLLGSLFF